MANLVWQIADHPSQTTETWVPLTQFHSLCWCCGYLSFYGEWYRARQHFQGINPKCLIQLLPSCYGPALTCLSVFEEIEWRGWANGWLLCSGRAETNAEEGMPNLSGARSQVVRSRSSSWSTPSRFLMMKVDWVCPARYMSRMTGSPSKMVKVGSGRYWPSPSSRSLHQEKKFSVMMPRGLKSRQPSLFRPGPVGTPAVLTAKATWLIEPVWQTKVISMVEGLQRCTSDPGAAGNSPYEVLTISRSKPQALILVSCSVERQKHLPWASDRAWSKRYTWGLPNPALGIAHEVMYVCAPIMAVIAVELRSSDYMLSGR